MIAKVQNAISEIAQKIGERYDLDFEKIGYDFNHIHILISFPPKYGGSEVVRIFKSITVRQLFLRFPELKKELWGGESYLTTVSEKGNWKVVENFGISILQTKPPVHFSSGLPGIGSA